MPELNESFLTRQIPATPQSLSGLMGRSTHCCTLPVIVDHKIIVPSRLFQVTTSPMADVGVGMAVIYPEYAIPEGSRLYELPDGKRFEKHRVTWAGMLKDAWVRVR